MVATAIAVAGLALGAMGAYTSYKGAQAQARTAKREAETRRQEAALKKVGDLRKNIRMMQLAQANAQAQAGAQGMGFGSSAYAGAMGGITQTAGLSAQNINRGFNFASQYADYNVQYAQAGQTQALGAGLTNLGGTMISGSGMFSRVGQQVAQGPQNIIPPGYPAG